MILSNRLKGIDLEQYVPVCTLADVFIEIVVVWSFVYLFPSSMVTVCGGEGDLKLGQNIVFICKLRPWHFIFGATAALNTISEGRSPKKT
jgi:hypothetical protein